MKAWQHILGNNIRARDRAGNEWIWWLRSKKLRKTLPREASGRLDSNQTWKENVMRQSGWSWEGLRMTSSTFSLWFPFSFSQVHSLLFLTFMETWFLFFPVVSPLLLQWNQWQYHKSPVDPEGPLKVWVQQELNPNLISSFSSYFTLLHDRHERTRPS